MRQGAKSNFARTLRRNMTDAEHHLWRHLRRRQLDGFRFRRQHPVGPYIADFVCVDAKLVVEVDGGQHLQSVADARRDACLRSHGFHVLRFWNNDVFCRTDDVLLMIVQHLVRTGCPLPPCGHLPPPAGEGILPRSSDAPCGHLPPQAGEGEPGFDERLDPRAGEEA